METELEAIQNLSVSFELKGYTKNVIDFFIDQSVEDLHFDDMQTIIDSGGLKDLLKHEAFLKRIEFLKKISLKDFKESMEVQEVREFLEKNWETRKIFWDYLPVDIACIEADQIHILRDLALANKGKSEIISEKIYDLILRKFYLKDKESAENVLDYFNMYLEVFTLTKDVSIVNSSFIDLLLLKHPMIITKLYKKGISISDSQLLRVLDSLKSDPKFLVDDYGSYGGVFAFLNQLLGVFYFNQMLLDFLIGYIKVTDRKKDKIGKFLESFHEILRNNPKKSQELKMFWLGFNLEMSSLVDFYEYKYKIPELLPKSSKNIIFKIVTSFFKEEFFYFSDVDRVEVAMSLLNDKDKKKLKNFLIDKLAKLDAYAIFYVNKLFLVLGQDMRILDIGLDFLEKEINYTVYDTNTFLDLCKIHNTVVYEKAKKIVEEKQLNEFLEKEKIGEPLRKLIVNHFN